MNNKQSSDVDGPAHLHKASGVYGARRSSRNHNGDEAGITRIESANNALAQGDAGFVNSGTKLHDNTLLGDNSLLNDSTVKLQEDKGCQQLITNR